MIKFELFLAYLCYGIVFLVLGHIYQVGNYVSNKNCIHIPYERLYVTLRNYQSFLTFNLRKIFLFLKY